MAVSNLDQTRYKDLYVIFGGQDDHVNVSETIDLLNQSFDQLNLDIYDKAGHYPMKRDYQDEITNSIIDFLKQ